MNMPMISLLDSDSAVSLSKISGKNSASKTTGIMIVLLHMEKAMMSMSITLPNTILPISPKLTIGVSIIVSKNSTNR